MTNIIWVVVLLLLGFTPLVFLTIVRVNPINRRKSQAPDRLLPAHFNHHPRPRHLCHTRCQSLCRQIPGHQPHGPIRHNLVLISFNAEALDFRNNWIVKNSG